MISSAALSDDAKSHVSDLAICVQGLTKRFPKGGRWGKRTTTTVLDDVSLSVGANEALGVVGLKGLLLLISGVYYSLSVLPLPLQLLGRVSPLTYTLEAVRGALISNWGVSTLLPYVGLLIVMGGVFLALGWGVFGWAERRARRLGLLKRSG